MELVMPVVAVGECMIELSRTDDGAGWQLRHGGDTLNVATYLARLGQPVAYLTALGDDPWSRAMRAAWVSEGIDTTLVLTNTRLPGLYAIETDAHGERAFHYWREQSAARALFDCVGIDAALATASRAGLLYLSGITLSLFEAADCARLVTLCVAVRARGGRVAFDPNYRTRGWPSVATARAAIATIAPHVDIVLPTFADEALLWGDATPADTLARWTGFGAREIAIKTGADGAFVGDGGSLIAVPARVDPAPRDTTGAGDSFNAAYLAGRLGGADPQTAARLGNRLAGEVVRHSGAIIAASAMPADLGAA